MSWKAEYAVLLAITTLTSYYAGILMGKSTDYAWKRRYLILSLVINLGILFFFKYFNFANDSLSGVLRSISLENFLPEFKLLLPVGISFYTFQSLSYVIDVYRGARKSEKHLGIFAVYVSFFPQLVAGPIERSERLLPQFFERHDIRYKSVTNGLKLMAWGFFKKIVIADRISIIVDKVYNQPTQFEGIYFIIATFAFGIQVYCDFSGYSDIAVGAAEVMGFRLMKNFHRPYHAKSVSQFWNRWHISLSTWLRDYLFLPVVYAVMRKIKSPHLFHIKAEGWGYGTGIIFTMFLGGLWHGANWTFVLWGCVHGIYLVFSYATKHIRKRIVKRIKLNKIPLLHKSFKIIITFLLVSFAWIFFRANTISDAFYIITHLHVNIGEFQPLNLSLTRMLGRLDIMSYDLLVLLGAVALLEIVHLLQRQKSIRERLEGKPFYFRWTLYILLISAIFSFGSFQMQQFIYFQF
jgi:D-alanyl-lipoteichoic acid acyltransferase DltB (MBOAT superfamily)